MTWLDSVSKSRFSRIQQGQELADIDKILAAHFAQLLPPNTDSKSQVLWHDLVLTLSFLQREGHSCLRVEDVAGKAWIAEVPLPAASDIHSCIESSLAHMPSGCFAYEHGCFYSGRYKVFERDIATAIWRRHSAEADVEQNDRPYDVASKHWAEWFDGAPFSSSPQDKQQAAVLKSLTSSMLIVNGGPGTGKTYTASRILMALNICHQNKQGTPLKVLLAAPTGKAAQRLTESLQSAAGQSAQTLHRLLGMQVNSIRPKYNEINKLNCDLVLVDEASMIDLSLMARLFRALPDSAKLILLGDANQLPSVESGCVLKELVDAAANHKVPYDVVTLTKSHRFGGTLGDFANAVLNGDRTAASAMLDEENEVVLLDGYQNSELFQQKAKQDFTPLFACETAQQALQVAKSARWLTPLRRGQWGIESLNNRIEKALSERFKHVIPGGNYAGKLIMVTQNHYSAKLFNGDIGVLWPDSEGHLLAWFEDPQGQLISHSISRLPMATSAFAMTVHKSQGAEFDEPTLVLPPVSELTPQTRQLIDRALLYTAITRAKRSITLIASQEGIALAMDQQHHRMSGLSQQIFTLADK